MRYARKVDDNQPAIVKALKSCGASVEPVQSANAGVVDLLVGCFGITELVEVKPGDAKDKRQRTLREPQVAWHRQWKGRPVVVVTSVDEAVALIGRMRGLMTQSEVARE